MNRPYLAGEFCYLTDIGKVRKTNEDRALALVNEHGNVLLIVLDGMGGQNKGGLASTLGLETIKKEFESKNKFYSGLEARFWVKKVIKKANQIIHEESLKDIHNHGMGTTLTMVLLLKGEKVVAQIGDSRLYEYKNNHLEQVTEDQSYVGYLYRTGQIKKEEMLTHPERHVLLNALGVYPTVNVDISLTKYDDSPLLLCSDGLYNNMDEMTIESILRSDDSVNQKCQQCIALANAHGGSDNIAVVIWECKR